MKLFVTLSALVLAGTAVSGDAPVAEESTREPDIDVVQLEFDDLGIDIGRLGMINDKTQEIWQILRPDEYHGESRNPVALSAHLRRTVWQLNELRENMCQDRFMIEKSCGAPYVPKWVFESSKVIPSAAELQKRQEDLADHVISIWDAACDRLRKIITTSDIMYYCSIE